MRFTLPLVFAAALALGGCEAVAVPDDWVLMPLTQGLSVMAPPGVVYEDRQALVTEVGELAGPGFHVLFDLDFQSADPAQGPPVEGAVYEEGRVGVHRAVFISEASGADRCPGGRETVWLDLSEVAGYALRASGCLENEESAEPVRLMYRTIRLESDDQQPAS